jgi:hypothetical protein
LTWVFISALHKRLRPYVPDQWQKVQGAPTFGVRKRHERRTAANRVATPVPLFFGYLHPHAIAPVPH